MPTYEYACTTCDEHLEVVQSFRDDPLTTCPACGGGLRKVFSPIGVVFKGSGFYKTDSRSSSTSGPAARDGAASASSSSGSSSGDASAARSAPAASPSGTSSSPSSGSGSSSGAAAAAS